MRSSSLTHAEAGGGSSDLVQEGEAEGRVSDVVVQPREMGSHSARPFEERWRSNGEDEKARRSILGQFVDKGSSSPSSLLLPLFVPPPPPPPETLVFMLLPLLLLLLSAEQELVESTDELRDRVFVIVVDVVRLVV